MMLRLQKERMDGGFIPSEREYFYRYGLDAEKLDLAKDDAIVMHPGPMNRGVEIDGEIADDINRSVIQEQVEMGVAVRMAAMHLLADNLKKIPRWGCRLMRVEPHERGRLHVFAVNRPKADIAAVFTPPETGADRLQPAPELLRDLADVDGLDPAGAELIPLADLVGLGLSGYLSEGLDIPEADIAEYKRKLDALEGYGLILTSRAFQGNSFALAETASLTHIASFDPPGTDWRPAGPMPSEAARPYSGKGQSPREARNRAQRMGGLIFAAFMIVIFAVIWMLVT